MRRYASGACGLLMGAADAACGEAKDAIPNTIAINVMADNNRCPMGFFVCAYIISIPPRKCNLTVLFELENYHMCLS